MHSNAIRLALTALLPFAVVAVASAVRAAPPQAEGQAEPFPSTLEPLPPPSASPPALTPSTPTSTAQPVASPAAKRVAPLPSSSATPKKKGEDAPATIFDSTTDFTFGGEGGVWVMYSRISHTDTVLVCGEAAVIVDHALDFGGAGCGVTTPIHAERYTGVSQDKLHFGYGGAIVRYHLFARQVANLSIGTMIGAGGVVIGENIGTDSSAYNDKDNFKEKYSEAIFVVEPQIGAFVNFTRWARFGVLAGYRFVSSVNTKNMHNSDIAGPSIGSTLQLGWF